MSTPKFLLAAMMTALPMLLPPAANAAEILKVSVAHGAPQELALKARVEAVVAKYKLGKWLYTGEVRIDKDAWPPRSHPVLTLGVRDALLSDDVYLVGALLHEEFHWNMVLNSRFMPDETTALVKARFPGLEPSRPKGAGDEGSTYNHVLVCYMEYRALASIFGIEGARKAIRALPFYTSIYALVTDKQNEEALEELLRQQELRI